MAIFHSSVSHYQRVPLANHALQTSPFENWVVFHRSSPVFADARTLRFGLCRCNESGELRRKSSLAPLICMIVATHTHTDLYIYVHIHIRMTCIYIYIYVYIYIYPYPFFFLCFFNLTIFGNSSPMFGGIETTHWDNWNENLTFWWQRKSSVSSYLLYTVSTVAGCLSVLLVEFQINPCNPLTFREQLSIFHSKGTSW